MADPVSDALGKERQALSAQQRRNLRAQQQGFPNEYARRKASEARRGIVRDYRAERELERRNAAREGYENVQQRRAYRRALREAQSSGKGKRATETALLRPLTEAWNVSPTRYRQMVKANREYSKRFEDPSGNWRVAAWGGSNVLLNIWNPHKNGINPRDVGYNIAFYMANVNKNSDYEAWVKYRRPRKGAKVYGEWDVRAPYEIGRWQYLLLVEYGDQMDADEFSERYGLWALETYSRNSPPKH